MKELKELKAKAKKQLENGEVNAYIKTLVEFERLQTELSAVA